MSRRIQKVLACPLRMDRFGTSEEGISRWEQSVPSLPGKWLLKWCVFMSLGQVCGLDKYYGFGLETGLALWSCTWLVWLCGLVLDWSGSLVLYLAGLALWSCT